MSLFKKLKGTFQHAQQDFAEGLRALASFDTAPRHELLKDIRIRQINLDAGADLLHSYQKSWAEMQTDTKESARKAEEIHVMMTPMFKRWDEHAEMMSQLEEEVKILPNLIASLRKSQDLLDALRKDFNATEKALDMLENLCEEIAQRECFSQELQKLTKYKHQIEAEEKKVKVELAQAHAKKIVELESAKRESLQERAEAFTSAFKEDVDYYKTYGHPNCVTTKFPQVSSLSDINIETDTQELDNFFGADAEAAEDSLAEDGAYIEDDYTEAFSVKQDVDAIDERDMLSLHDQLTITNIEYEDDSDEQQSNFDRSSPTLENANKDKSEETTEDKNKSLDNSILNNNKTLSKDDGIFEDESSKSTS